MAENQNVKLEQDGLWQYQQRLGLNRKFPMNGVPKTAKRELTAEEQELLSAPMIKHARKEKHSAETTA